MLNELDCEIFANLHLTFVSSSSDLSLVAVAGGLAVTLYILSLRLRAQRDQPPPWPPNRKMGGVLTYEFGKICSA